MVVETKRPRSNIVDNALGFEGEAAVDLLDAQRHSWLCSPTRIILVLGALQRESILVRNVKFRIRKLLEFMLESYSEAI